jgi:two-component system, response regulator PdtaR
VGTETMNTMADLLKSVVIIDPSRPSAKILADMLKAFGAKAINILSSDYEIRANLGDCSPSLIISEYGKDDYDGIDFVRRLRRSDLSFNQVSVIMVAGIVTKSVLNQARNAGINELMLKQYSWTNLERRLEAIAFQPRAWIEVATYIGPDRRRFNSADFEGDLKRRVDVDDKHPGVRLAVYKLHAAVDKLDSGDPQVLATILAQLEILLPVMKYSQNLEVKASISLMIQHMKHCKPTKEALKPLIWPMINFFRNPEVDKSQKSNNLPIAV